MIFTNIEIFYDGLQIDKYSNTTIVHGFTTNCTFFSTHSVKNYNNFYNSNKEYIKNKPISFQIWDDNIENAIQQINDIHKIDNAIFIKIPVINTRGIYNLSLFDYVLTNNIPVNITAVYTYDQIDILYSVFKNTNTPTIISIFGGPISDLGFDPIPYARYLVQIFRNNYNVKILYAGIREPYSILQAEKAGCHIATVPDSVLEKLLCNKSLLELSIDRVTKFRNDAVNGRITIN